MAFVNFNIESFTKDLSGLIAIPSVSNQLDEVRKALHYMVDLAKSMKLEAYTLLDDQVGIIEMGQGEETIGILVHVDVVDVGDETKWSSSPYELALREGRLYGRGVADDKGPAMIALHVLHSLKPFEKEMHKKIQLIIGTQEEVEWRDINAYVSGYKVPDYGFTPDGEFPITNIEKGYADVEVLFAISDPGKVKAITAGHSLNSVPDFAQITLTNSPLLNLTNPYLSVEDDTEQLHITAKTVSAHSSKPMKGVNAIWEMVRSIKDACRVSTDLSTDLGDYNKVIDFIANESMDDAHGLHFGLNLTPDEINGQKLDPTVITPTLMRMVDQNRLMINFNIRHSFGIDKSFIISAFDQKKKQYGFDLRIKDYMDFLYVSNELPFIKIMAETYTSITGLANTFELAHGTSYAKAMPNFVAWGPYFPDEEDSCHEVNENISLNSLVKSGEIYFETLKKMTLIKESLK